MKYFGGIDLGGTNSKIGLLDENGNLIFNIYVKTNSKDGYELTSKRLAENFKLEIEKKGINYEDVLAIGMGVPGPVVNNSTILMFANFNWPSNLNLAKFLEKDFEKPVFLDNDVNVITLGEMYKGAAQGYENVLGIAIGTGIGAGIVINKEVISGKNGAAGEFGHLTVEKNGKLCGCGKKGCLEAYSSATGIVRLAKDSLAVDKKSQLHNYKENLEAKDVFLCANDNDKLSLEIVDEISEYIAMGIGNVLNVIDSEVVVIGGGVAQAGDILFDRIKKQLSKYAIGVINEKIEIKPAKLGNDAGIYGAAYLAKTKVGKVIK